MVFTQRQKSHVLRQLSAHKRNSGIRNIILDKNNNINLELIIEQGVFGSDIISTAVYFARFLYQHQELYFDKDVVDIGCGPGTQGIIMSKYGAKSVVFSDINPKAVINTKNNIEKQNLTNIEIYESDLFDSLPKNKTYDLIVFNHPFFSGEAKDFENDPNKNEMLRRSMLGGTKLIDKFFREISKYLSQDGLVIMPYWHFAGIENDPANHLPNYNLMIDQEYKIESLQGLQIGNISVYIISKNKFGY